MIETDRAGEIEAARVRERGMSARSTCLLLGSAAALALWGCGALAQVTLDGTANPDFEGPLDGPDYQIRAELGHRAGRNLFHSFDRFDLRTGESATFSGPDAIRNVISRVTGGVRSDIDGTLRSTIPGANFYFLNPAGAVFGPNASLDLHGSFHVSTADELRFADGAAFTVSSLTVAAPKAFGFLGAAPRPILVDRSRLEVPANESFSIVGGDITIDGGDSGGELGRIEAEAGAVTLLASGGAGNARIVDGRLSGSGHSDIVLKDQASIDVSGDGGGTVRIEGGQIVMSDFSGAVALNTGSANAAGGVFVTADLLKMNAGFIEAAAFGAGDAGAVTVTAGRIELREISRIDGRTHGDGDPVSEDGDAGPVTVTAGSIEISGLFSEIAGDSFADGDAGPVTIIADRIELRDNATISSETRGGTGDAGSVTVRAGELELRRAGGISSGSGSESIAAGAGNLTIVADSIEFSGGGTISAGGNAGSNAGSVTVNPRSPKSKRSSVKTWPSR